MLIASIPVSMPQVFWTTLVKIPPNILKNGLDNCCRKSGGESVLASFPRSDYASNFTNVGWLAWTGYIF
jgi:hypothetical protein